MDEVSIFGRAKNIGTICDSKFALHAKGRYIFRRNAPTYESWVRTKSFSVTRVFWPEGCLRDSCLKKAEGVLKAKKILIKVFYQAFIGLSDKTSQ